MPVDWFAIILVSTGVAGTLAIACYHMGYYKGRFEEICSQRTVDVVVETSKPVIERVK